MNRTDYRQAVAKAIAEEMLRDPRLTIKGEDVLEEVENEDIVEATSLGEYHVEAIGTRTTIFKSLLLLVCAAFVPLVLFREVADAFMTNPGLNFLILAVLIFAVSSGLASLFRLHRSVHWLKRTLASKPKGHIGQPPDLIVPLVGLTKQRAGHAVRSALTIKTAVDLTRTRLVEDQRFLRDLIVMLLLLGLLGSIWGGAGAVAEARDAIQALSVTSGNTSIRLWVYERSPASADLGSYHGSFNGPICFRISVDRLRAQRNLQSRTRTEPCSPRLK